MALDAKLGIVLDERHKLGHDEPVFVLRGKDFVAPQAILAYAELAAGEGAPEEHVRACRLRADEIVRWQQQNPALVKVPD